MMLANRLAFLIAIASAGCAASAALQGDHWVLLPANAVKKALPLCSREGPKIDGTWTPSQAEVADLEKNLPALNELSTKDSAWSKAHPEQAFRQYLGITVDRHRYIYINAIYGGFSPRDRTEFTAVCDGGAAFWGAMYDPATHRFSDLRTNGQI